METGAEQRLEWDAAAIHYGPPIPAPRLKEASLSFLTLLCCAGNGPE